MMSFLSGLDKFGLGKLENEQLFGDKNVEEKKQEEKPVEITIKKVEEKDFLFEKRYECPICGKEFTALTVRSGKVRVKSVDQDLRPVYDQVDQIKYDILACPHCGYAALGRYFPSLARHQVDAIKKKICASFRPQNEKYETYSYEVAMDRYQLALANAMVKQAKDSEKAYLCLKTAWLLRGQREHLNPADPKLEAKTADLLKQEDVLLGEALKGFVMARQKESSPIAGMDAMTLDYLLASLSLRAGQYEQAAKLISEILTSRTASSHLKEKTRGLKEELEQRIRG